LSDNVLQHIVTHLGMTHLQVVAQNPEHFQQVWEREDQSFRQERRDQEQRRSRDRGGWSR
jgi:hypothetical protein